MQKQPWISLAEARSKMQRYCAYQERCHAEVAAKLAALGVGGDDARVITAELVTAGFLNETRFAKAFAGGKFRQLAWGRVKIRLELKRRGLNNLLINAGMQEIDPDDYLKTLRQIAEKKLRQTSGNPLKRKAAVVRYLTGKGYEADLIREVMDELFS
jgi:regulatory protein